jgi:uncharacterized protein (DUF305 family)
MEHMHHARHPYISLSLMALLSFVVMYILMYAMVDTLGNVFANINKVYMAGLMTAPMVLIELALMRSMYPRPRVNVGIGIAAALVGVGLWMAIREQGAVRDEQFLRSMIPHHAGAILMCERAELADPENRALCAQIIRSQQEEIDQMKARLRETQG